MIIVPNPISDRLVSTNTHIFEVIRRAYLDDLIYKEGVASSEK